MNAHDFEKFYAEVDEDAVRVVCAVLHLKREQAEEAVQNSVVYILGRLPPHRTFFNEVGAPGVTRTPGPQFRKLLLYPPELRGRPHLRPARR